MVIIQSNNFYQHKDVLMSQKCGDTFSIDINLKNGQRFYNVLFGRKWVTFKAIYGHEKIKIHSHTQNFEQDNTHHLERIVSNVFFSVLIYSQS